MLVLRGKGDDVQRGARPRAQLRNVLHSQHACMRNFGKLWPAHAAPVFSPVERCFARIEMDLSDAALSTLAPDAVRADLRVAARGRVLFCVPVTKCVLIFAVEEAGVVVDCIARTHDGWVADAVDELASALSQPDAASVTLDGFPERLPQGALCLHVQRVTLASRTWSAAAAPQLSGPARPLSVNPKNNASRFPAFAEFLLTAFGGHEALSTGAGVLDVAGGAGGLAFELSVRRQLPCVVVDPRELRVTADQQYVLDHRKGVRAAVVPWIEVSPLAASVDRKFACAAPTQLRELFDSTEVLDVIASEGRGDESRSSAVATAARDCSVLVGLHPDQALDHIVAVALALRKPFAVAPCCVFWKHGRNRLRVTPSGETVKTYEQLCEHVLARAPGIREAKLRFHGQNRVFWWIPPPEEVGTVDGSARCVQCDGDS